MNESDDALESDEPWKTLLQASARAAWRVAEPTLPSAAESAQERLLRGRTRKQLQFTQRNTIIPTQQALAKYREAERKRVLQGKDNEPSARNAEPLVYGPDEALAALQFRLHPNMAVTKRILREAKSLLGNKVRLEHVLDFGIGVGSASLAALEVWPSIDWVHGIDASQVMREAATEILQDYIDNSPCNARMTMSAHLSSEPASPAFDLVLFAYTASEMAYNSANLAAAAVLWEKVRPGGLFVMVEPGTPDGFSTIRSVRNMLLDCAEPGQLGDDECHIIAPCTHNGSCPMERFVAQRYARQPPKQQQMDAKELLQQDEGPSDSDELEPPTLEDDTRRGFCSFVQTMPHGRSKGEKFSYLVAQKRLTGLDAYSDDDDGVNVAELLEYTQRAESATEISVSREAAAQLVDHYLRLEDDELGLELVEGDSARASFGRIVHAPMKRRGHVLIDVCADPGRIVRHTITKANTKQAPGTYRASRKSKWGGLWPNIPSTETKL